MTGTNYSGTVRPLAVAAAAGFNTWIPNAGDSTVGMCARTDGSGGVVTYDASATLAAQTVGSGGGNQGGFAVSITPAAYTAGTFYRDHEITFPLAEGNTGSGIGRIVVNTYLGYWQFNVAPVFAKDATKVLKITIRLSWARH